MIRYKKSSGTHKSRNGAAYLAAAVAVTLCGLLCACAHVYRLNLASELQTEVTVSTDVIKGVSE